MSPSGYRLRILFALLLAGGGGFAPAPTVAQTAPPAAGQSLFQQGAADRQSYEQWFAALTGAFRSGAFYWAAVRNDSTIKSDCWDRNRQSYGDFTQGCEAAKLRLAPVDELRKREPEYRKGFNSLNPPPPTKPANCMVVGIKPDDSDGLTIRATPSRTGAVAGRIPSNGRGVVNDNCPCDGDPQKQPCHVNYNGVDGFVSGQFLFPEGDAPAAPSRDAPTCHGLASFDCSRAKAADELLICRYEAARNADCRLGYAYNDAMRAAGASEDRKKLAADERTWIAARLAACGVDSSDTTAACFAEQTNQRVAELVGRFHVAGFYATDSAAGGFFDSLFGFWKTRGRSANPAPLPAKPKDPCNTLSGDAAFDQMDAAKAVPACLAAVERNPASVHFWGMLGRAYLKADNTAEAVQWYQKAADQGDDYGQYMLGWMNQYGVGFDRNIFSIESRDADAIKWYGKCAAQGGWRASYAKQQIAEISVDPLWVYWRSYNFVKDIVREHDFYFPSSVHDVTTLYGIDLLSFATGGGAALALVLLFLLRRIIYRTIRALFRLAGRLLDMASSLTIRLVLLIVGVAAIAYGVFIISFTGLPFGENLQKFNSTDTYFQMIAWPIWHMKVLSFMTTGGLLLTGVFMIAVSIRQFLKFGSRIPRDLHGKSRHVTADDLKDHFR